MYRKVTIVERGKRDCTARSTFALHVAELGSILKPCQERFRDIELRLRTIGCCPKMQKKERHNESVVAFFCSLWYFFCVEVS